jgi:hypothetical protein
MAWLNTNRSALSVWLGVLAAWMLNTKSAPGSATS